MVSQASECQNRVLSFRKGLGVGEVRYVQKASRRRWHFSREEHGEGETHRWGCRWVTLDPGPPGSPTPSLHARTLIRLGWIDKGGRAWFYWFSLAET